MARTNQDWRASGYGLLGVTIFSGSLPATRVALLGFTPLFLTAARATIAAMLGVVLLWSLRNSTRRAMPQRKDVGSLVIIAAGVVVGFPLLTALALQHVTSAHSIVSVGFLPLSTAIFGVLRNAERPRPMFWLFSVAGGAVIATFAIAGDSAASPTGDLLMLAAVVTCGLGYAEGARLSRRLGGWQVISWALVLALPLMLPMAMTTRPDTLAGIAPRAWSGLAYVSSFSMLIGFVFWYRGLALGGVARIGQLQLLQPFLGLLLAAWLLREPVAPAMVVATLVVAVCVVLARKYA